MPGRQMITLDPLSRHADPRLYVSLESGERALAEIGASLCSGRSPVLLSGPAGVGKTMLLSVLAERERASRVSVRFARSLAHPPEAVGGWLLRLLFGKSAADAGAAELAVLNKLRAVGNEPILLLVDEIQLAPIGSVRKLAALARGAAPALAVVVCGRDGSDLRAMTAMLAPEVTVSLPEFLPEREIETLFDAILAHPGLSPRVLHRLESVARVEILRAASGLPALLRAELARHDLRKPARAVVSAVAEPAAEKKPGRPARERVRAAAMLLPRAIGSAALLRPATDSLAHSAMTRVRAKLGLAAREAARARDLMFATGREHAACLSTELGAVARRTVAGVRKRSNALARSKREVATRSTATAARAGGTARRAAPAAALPAAALLAVAVFSLSDIEAQLRPPAPVADVAGLRSVSSAVSVQVNARPWARVRIDGVDLGATPLTHQLVPGVYQLEAEFPDGKRIERKIDVRPESRFVSLP